MTGSRSEAEGTRIAAVAIGRNEGARLVACLASLSGRVGRLVYVDSGSTDGSVAAAEAAGAEIVRLDMNLPFTAARARNAGLARLREGDPAPVYAQLVDGDCTVVEGWIEHAAAFLDTHPAAAAVCGRRRERHPDASVYNRLCDIEWNTPVGRTKACGGDAMMRMAALTEAGGFRETLIAGEEPELCLRLRAAGWEIWRIDAEMTLHDAAMTRFGQWWRRTRRAGHAFAEGAALHGRGPERHWVRETVRALAWGAGLPAAAAAGAVTLGPAALAVLTAYPLQVIRLAMRNRSAGADAWTEAGLSVLGKFAETQGILGYALGRVTARPQSLIEYKGAAPR